MMKFNAFSTPKTFVFIDPDTGFSYTAATKEQLITHILNYRQQNKLAPIEFLNDVLENYWCSLPENLGSCQRVPLHRGIVQTVRGGIALLQNLFYGERNMVDTAVAEQRAAVCVECPNNQFPDKEGFVKWSDDLAELTTGGKRTSTYEQLGSCIACSCPLKCKVWFGGKFSLSAEERATMEALKTTNNISCWQLL